VNASPDWDWYQLDQSDDHDPYDQLEEHVLNVSPLGTRDSKSEARQGWENYGGLEERQQPRGLGCLEGTVIR
jgi:hypothetical protein